jgi:shikimate 5-dehydrogenase
MDNATTFHPPATRQTMYFIGVSTRQSSIMKVLPHWAKAFGLDAALMGRDFPLDSAPVRYREAVAFIKADPLSLGALVTPHKSQSAQGGARPLRRSRPAGA